MTEPAAGGSALSPAARRLYRMLARTVVDTGADEATGTFPEVSDTRPGGDLAALGELVDAGLVEYDADTGMVNAVLPLVAGGPSILVVIDGKNQTERRAAGVLDAFALAPLIGRGVRIDDRCPTCGEPVQVLIDPERIRRREPRSAVVVRVPADGSRQGRYDAARLACSPEHAHAAIAASGHAEATMQSIEALNNRARQRYATVLL